MIVAFVSVKLNIEQMYSALLVKYNRTITAQK